MSVQVLASEARRLNRAAGAPALPALFFLTDPARTPDPIASAAKLPRGAAVIYRHFGAPERFEVAAALSRICIKRGLFLLISADPALARKVGAAGVHWPEARARRRLGFELETMSAHSPAALSRAFALGMDAALLSPVFATRSASASGRSLGAARAGRWARAARLPVIALGGVNMQTARALRARGFAGLAAIEALA
ncbi:MAG: thiamine phosphate synthase [Hyphomonadaceae bacterium]|nr:thiamine phosphate synthase [Hyphomonadaceae bacterium]